NKPEIGFNYTEQFNITNSKILDEIGLQPVPEAVGSSISPRIERNFSIDSRVITKETAELQVNIIYNKQEYKGKTIEKLKNNYLNCLREIINYYRVETPQKNAKVGSND
ncbi:MAG: hypothetical protein MUF15_09680, partial [Acidobacteria bacterium]|nr:hypothetical protein [Acidobacteriota bacterium]